MAATSSRSDILLNDLAGDGADTEDIGRVKPIARPNREPIKPLPSRNPLWPVPLSGSKVTDLLGVQKAVVAAGGSDGSPPPPAQGREVMLTKAGAARRWSWSVKEKRGIPALLQCRIRHVAVGSGASYAPFTPRSDAEERRAGRPSDQPDARAVELFV
jgi:hypothetical protein